jgi:hypothetical protein
VKKMTEKKDDKKKNKGPIAAIWESMTKTGGCCGSDDSCGCSPKEVDKNKDSKKAGKK